jgi:hypothetical protein
MHTQPPVQLPVQLPIHLPIQLLIQLPVQLPTELLPTVLVMPTMSLPPKAQYKSLDALFRAAQLHALLCRYALTKR